MVPGCDKINFGQPSKHAMAISPSLQQRCNDECELCAANTELLAYAVPPTTGDPDDTIAVCNTCLTQIEK